MKAQSECLELSRSMYNKLPKELRNSVYAYLCLEDRRIPIGPYYHFRKYEPLEGKEMEYSDTQFCPRDGDLKTELADGKTRIDHDIYPEEDLVLPSSHIFDPSYMSQDIVLELLKIYYESNSFSVCNVEGGLDELCTPIPASSAPSEFVPIDHEKSQQVPNSDWDNNYWILPIESTRLTSQQQAELGGYSIDDLGGILHSRWGVDDIFRETVSTRNVVEGPYWPVGRPTNPSAIYMLSNKPALSFPASE
ncbi:hypothetical protein N0V87_009773 [Didymella glomerata]|uniref:Uncharacterized protein n=1 Tax=Didymella glomerata TaxID=749621 RepID=A0A9W9BVN7_9PLEO|nr:hypothetical protein N0V87_009773 [Didymella glomerata]